MALANKNARIPWAVMTRANRYDPHHVGVKHGASAPAAAAAWSCIDPSRAGDMTKMF